MTTLTTPGNYAQSIVIVDSDRAAALVTQHGIQRALGSAVVVRIAPSSAKDWFATYREPIDLLMLDPSPHNHTATTMLKAFHEAYPTTPVLILTSHDTPRLRREMRDLGVTHYLSKPIKLQLLEQSVRLALGIEKFVV